MINLVSDTIDRSDVEALSEWMLQTPTPKLTKGDLTRQFEEEWAKKIGTKHAVFVNSGSSAILLTLAALLEYDKDDIKRGRRSTDIVIPNLCWATDASSPLLLKYGDGGNVVLVGCNRYDLSVDLDQLEEAFQDYEPGYLLLVSVLGLVPDMESIVEMCDRHDVILIEDACESLGSKYQGNHLGTFGEASVFSLYFGHHLSTIEGGMINTNDTEFYNLLLCMRSHGWVRDCNETIQKQYSNLHVVDGFNEQYTFYHPGLNVRSTDLQAFLGLRQLEKFDDVVQKRNKNYKLYKSLVNNQLSLPERPGDFVSNFAFPVVNNSRNKIVEELKKQKIECRPLICGSMATQPFMVDNFEHIYHDYELTEMIDNYGFYVPNHPGMTETDIRRIAAIINYFSRK